MKKSAAVVLLAVCLTGCATTQSSQIKGLIAGSDDPKYTEATIAQLKEAGADEAIIQEHFALQKKFKDRKISEHDYEIEMGKLQVRMDANRVEREKKRQQQRAAFSVLQSVAGVALSAFL